MEIIEVQNAEIVPTETYVPGFWESLPGHVAEVHSVARPVAARITKGFNRGDRVEITVHKSHYFEERLTQFPFSDAYNSDWFQDAFLSQFYFAGFAMSSPGILSAPPKSARAADGSGTTRTEFNTGFIEEGTEGFLGIVPKFPTLVEAGDFTTNPIDATYPQPPISTPGPHVIRYYDDIEDNQAGGPIMRDVTNPPGLIVTISGVVTPA